MFYKYVVSYPNGTQLSGYAESEESMPAVKRRLTSYFFGRFNLAVEEYGEDFPKVNSDYIMTIK